MTADLRKRAPEAKPWQARASLECAPRRGSFVPRQIVERLEALVHLSQLGDHLIDQGGAQGQRRQQRRHLRVRGFHRLPIRHPRADRRPLVGALPPAVVDARHGLADAVERSEDGVDVLLLQLPAIRQEDQLSRRRELVAHSIRQADQRLHGARQRRQRGLHRAAGVLDPPSELLFLARLEQLPFADIAQIHPHEIELLTRDPCLDRFAVAGVAMRIFTFRVGNRLIVEGLRIFFTQQTIGQALSCARHDRRGHHRFRARTRGPGGASRERRHYEPAHASR